MQQTRGISTQQATGALHSPPTGMSLVAQPVPKTATTKKATHQGPCWTGTGRLITGRQEPTTRTFWRCDTQSSCRARARMTRCPPLPGVRKVTLSRCASVGQGASAAHTGPRYSPRMTSPRSTGAHTNRTRERNDERQDTSRGPPAWLQRKQGIGRRGALLSSPCAREPRLQARWRA